MMKRFFCSLLAIFITAWSPIYSYAMTVSSYTGTANKAIGSLVGGKLSSFGESAAITRTLSAMGGRVAALGSACGMTGPASALCTVAGGVATGVVTCAAMWETGCRQTLEWAYDKTLSLMFSGGTVTASGSAMSPTSSPIYSSGTTSGGYCWTVAEGCFGSYQEALAYTFSKTMSTYPKASFNQPSFSQINATQVDATYTYSIPELFLNNMPATKSITRSVASMNCSAGYGILNGACVSNGVANTVLGTPSAYTPSAKSVPAVVSDVPDVAGAKPISNDALAAAANALWKAAAAADSAAASWSQARAITAAEVEAWRAANPGLIPTVRDMAAPLAPSTSTDNPSFPYSPTGSGVDSGTTSATSVNVTVNWPASSTWTRSGGKGNIPTIQPKIDSARSELQSKLNAIKNESKSILGLSLSGQGQLPSFRTVILGKEIVFDFNDYSAQLSMIASALVFASLVAAFFLAIK
jgi:hypothetical protein